MYHPGKVLEVFKPKDRNIESSDNSTQAALEMWDENLITVLVDQQISKSIKKGDIVLVDYRPLPNTSAPRLTITKILKGAMAKDIWKRYKEYQKKIKTKKPVIQKIPIPQEHYVG
ncbi:MAG: hypothetical protein QXD48_00665 [Candidatus Aenigmatarchaeota archaeon]